MESVIIKRDRITADTVETKIPYRETINYAV